MQCVWFKTCNGERTVAEASSSLREKYPVPSSLSFPSGPFLPSSSNTSILKPIQFKVNESQYNKSHLSFRVSSPPLSSFSVKRKSFQSGFREFWERKLEAQKKKVYILEFEQKLTFLVSEVRSIWKPPVDEGLANIIYIYKFSREFTLISQHKDRKLRDPSLCPLGLSPQGQDQP